MRKIIAAAVVAILVCACSSIDCPVQNSVYTVYGLYKSNGKTDTLSDTLTISTKRAAGTDSVLINKDVAITSFDLPVSYSAAADTLFFDFTDTTSTNYMDTVTVTKTNTPHFESVDCSPSYFHTITGVKWTKNRIDSIVVNNSTVNYDASKQHFHIYFKSGN